MYSTQCLQLDILQSALDQDDPNHILCALPTGFGKTMPMLLLGHLLPPGAGIPILEEIHNPSCTIAHFNEKSAFSSQFNEKCMLQYSSIAVTNLKLCREKYKATPGRKSML